MVESQPKVSTTTNTTTQKPTPKNSNLVLSLLALYIGYVVYCSLNDGNIPQVPDFYWGSDDLIISQDEDVTISPFQINLEDNVALNQLKLKLEEECKSTRLKNEIKSDVLNKNEAAEIGLESNFIQNIAEYWKDNYKWSERVKLINKYPHFTTVLSGLKIHFQRIKASDGFITATTANAKNNNTKTKGKNPRPLLLLHGWPSSFTEFQKLIPLLMDSERMGFSFELIIPSLPGFAYSEGSNKPGLGPVAISHILLKLMQRLGHENFFVHGASDWGSVIATTMATVYPVNVVGIHLHQCVSKHPKSMIRHLVTSVLSYLIFSSEESLRSSTFYLEPSGSHIVKPDSMSIALSNSPTGLLAYIIEMNSAKFNVNNDNVVSIDDILDNVMIYWLTNSIVSSSKIFVNQLNKKEQSYNLDSVSTFVPTMCTFYPTTSSHPQQSESYLWDKYAQILRINHENTQSPTTVANNIIESFMLLESKGFSGFDRKHTCHIGPQPPPDEQ